MLNISLLPSRQKILLGLTIIAGLILIICSAYDLLPPNKLNKYITFYAIGVPLFLLVFDTFIDLNNKNVFIIWLTIGVIFLIAQILSSNSDKFKFSRSSGFDATSKVNSLISNNSTSALKCLLFFLIVYWGLNKLLKAIKGVYLVNTFWQFSWYHDTAQREMNWLDVLLNMVLFATIIVAGLFSF